MILELETLAPFAQFGTAGLVAWMWLTERRSATAREQQLNESHRTLTEQRVQLDALLDLVQDNTRAFAAMEAGQRMLIDTLERLRVPKGAMGDLDDGHTLSER